MTEQTVLQRKFAHANPCCKVLYDEPMSEHTSLRIGGPAEIMAYPSDADQLAQLLKLSALLDCKLRILGAGTNILAPDGRVEGITVCLRELECLSLPQEDLLKVGAGVSMTRAAVFAAGNGLSGLEFAHGIPGSIGGGVYMNAGAYGGELCQVIESVEVMDQDGNVKILNNAQLGFSYRHSNLQNTGDIVLSATLRLKKDEPEAIRARMKELMTKRSASQPLDLPSAGSAFKRPAGGYAAALIDKAGLKGYQVGGAAISTKHAGFAVNLGGATARDMCQLLTQVSDIVFERSGIRLEPEVRIW